MRIEDLQGITADAVAKTILEYDNMGGREAFWKTLRFQTL